MRILLTAIMVMAVALSGCAGSESGSDPTTGPVDSTGGGNETVDPGQPGEGVEGAENGTPAENLVPILTVTADALNGTAPLLVNFTVDVDDDSENLTWVFSVDGNETLTGTEVPATFNHTFQAGDFNVTVSVSDGEHTVDEALRIEALALVEDTGPLVDVTKTLVLPCLQCSDLGPAASVGGWTQASGAPRPDPRMVPDVIYMALPAEASGMPFTIESSGGDPDAFFAATCYLVDEEITFATGGGTLSAGDGLESGIVPDGAGCVWIWESTETPEPEIHFVVG